MAEGREPVGPGITGFLQRRRRLLLIGAFAIGGLAVIAGCQPVKPPPPNNTTPIISGTVSANASPVTSAAVNVYDSTANFVDATTTDVDGKYTIAVSPGEYKVSFTAGFSGLCEEWFDDQPTFDDAHTIVLVSGSSTIANAELDCATVSGTVVDGEGNPIAGVSVQRPINEADLPFPITVTDEHGAYTGAIGAGDHRLQFDGPNGCTVYFDHKPSLASADTLSVPANGLDNVDAVLDCATVSGTVTDGTNALANVVVVLLDEVGGEAGFGLTNASGEYALRVGPGDFTLGFLALDEFGAVVCEEWFEDQPDQSSATVLTLAPDETATANAELDCS